MVEEEEAEEEGKNKLIRPLEARGQKVDPFIKSSVLMSTRVL